MKSRGIMPVCITAIIAFTIFHAVGLSWAQMAGMRLKKDMGTVCLNCHKELKIQLKKGNVHKTVKSGECIACHDPHASKNKRLLFKKGPELCNSCHDPDDIGMNSAVKHEPVEFGECQRCHKPHVSENKKLLVNSRKEICYICHDKKAFIDPNNYIHNPTKGGRCEVCHLSHSSDLAFLEKSPLPALCLNCHKRVPGHENIDMSSANCAVCHSPHSTKKENLIFSNAHKPYQEKRCDECHEIVSGKIKKVNTGTNLCCKCHYDPNTPVKYGCYIDPNRLDYNNHMFHIVPGEKACTLCHNPHGSERQYLIRSSDGRLCMSCHGEIRERLIRESDVSRHPEVRARRCFLCHESHVAKNEKFIKENIVDICLSCHTRQKVFCHPIGHDALDPRTKKPINCLTCHNPMGAEYPQLLRLDGREALCRQCHKNY